MQPLSPSQRESLEEATSAYETALAHTPDAALYLLGRGLDPETVASFRLGVVDDPLVEHKHLRGRVSIPYLGRRNQPLWLKFRCLEEHNCRELNHGKYGTAAGAQSRIFNVRAFDQATDEIHVAEGEFDAMILNQIGLPAVAIPGVQNWKPHYRRLLMGFNRIWVWADPDEAGADLANTIARGLHQAKTARLRDGDVTHTYLEGGREALLELITDKEN